MAEGQSLLERLRERFAGEGLFVVLPVGGELVRGSVPFARGAVLVGDGGGEFFSRFLAAGEGSEKDPLDSYTRRRVRLVVEEVVGGEFAIFHPFASEKVHLPFQRLGMAAGLPAPGPLGVQVHPRFGPWWAYRALVALGVPLAGPGPLAGALAESCPACAGPCVNDCREHPLEGGRWVAGGLRGDIVCSDACGARLRCPVGPGARYSPEQIAFHARARRAAVPRRA